MTYEREQKENFLWQFIKDQLFQVRFRIFLKNYNCERKIDNQPSLGKFVSLTRSHILNLDICLKPRRCGILEHYVDYDINGSGLGFERGSWSGALLLGLVERRYESVAAKSTNKTTQNTPKKGQPKLRKPLVNLNNERSTKSLSEFYLYSTFSKIYKIQNLTEKLQMNL